MISIVIPCYEMCGRGVEMLSELIDSIRAQTCTDYETVISDGSRGTEIGAYCFRERLNRVHGKSGAAANLNNAIDHAKGDIIKPMFQDDKFIEPDSLEKIAHRFERTGHMTEEDKVVYTEPPVEWVACTSHNAGDIEAYDHVPYPHASLKALREGENTYGGPSAMAWHRNDLRFDENLHWLFDCEFYARMAERYGVPAFVDTPIYVRQWDGTATRTVATGSQRVHDHNYVVEKYR